MIILNKNRRDNFLIYFLITYPLLFFIFNNLDQLFHFSRLFYIGSFFLIFPIIFICFIFLNIKNNFLIKYKIPLFFSLIWFFQFYFTNIRSYFSSFNKEIDGYISLIIVLLLSIITTYLIKYNFLKKFFLLFLIINLSLSFISSFNFFSVIDQKKYLIVDTKK